MKYLRTRSNEVGTSSTADCVIACVNRVPQGGINLDEQRNRLRVLDAVDAATAGEAPYIALEDADAKTLQRCVTGMQWAVVNRSVVAFADAVANMPDTKHEVADGQ